MSGGGAPLEGTGVRVIDAARSAAVVPADHRGAISRAVAEVRAEGKVSMKLCEMESGGGADAHAHAGAAQVLLVIAGELTVATTEGVPLTVAAGSAAVFDPGAAHEVRNEGGAPVRYVALTADVPAAEHA